jgi:ABC-type phosphate transport system substrate-binding protein
MPGDVFASLIGAPIQEGMTDITPYDAKVATDRAFSLGYSAANPFHSGVSGSTSSVSPVTFTLPANVVITDIGAAPIVILVNKTNNADGHLGSAAVTNVNRFTLAGLLDGTFTRTRDIIKDDGLPAVTVTVFNREALSGTYNTMEYCIPNNAECKTTQESGYAPGTNVVGNRVRVIGTGQMTANVNSTADSLGYSFWSAGNFAGLTNTKYITVDGVDPIQDSYAGGAYPANPPLSHVADGSYPVWSVLRMVTIGPISTDVANIINNPIPGDFIPVKFLRVFRSHRATKDLPVASNGLVSGTTEAGADAGGAIFLINNELDYNDATGGELTDIRQ